MYAKDNHATAGAHFNLSTGTVFLNKYQVVQVAGTGNFARVYECVDINTKQRVAVKVLKKGYERDADFECDVLKGIGRSDPNDAEGIVKLVERTTYQGLAVIVFKLKGAPLRNARLPMPDSEAKQVVQDAADALAFLHFRVKAVHTDLKPENILAELSSVATVNGVRKWCLCDFGSASFYKEGQLDRDLITTRPYRAPEVVLNRGWSFPSDTWSLGCILYELRTGKKLFDCHTDADHLKMMEDRLGAIPSSMRGAMRVPQNFSARPPRTIMEEFRHEPDFLSLLMSMLDFDPVKRIRCDAIRSHPYMSSSTGSSSIYSASSAPAAPLSGRTSSYHNMDNMMRNMQPINDENADMGSKKSFPPVLSAPPTQQSAFTFAPSAATNGGTIRSGLGNYTTTNSAAYGLKGPSTFTAPLAAAKRRAAGDIYADAIPMSERMSSRPYAAANSAPTSASNSPVRLGSLSAQNSPRLISPAYPAASNAAVNRPLSYRLTYL
ncbi:protein kinase, putative [Bodo saltans]|uniref:Protein kinase, putative n=1 Tax=Bodo saltans TaxID=75058 RepID=A0A0S4JKY3_BODSA|nr:protein kinase, putative [Bodo saltans]|eukprot:CUG92200.1 protein kinase, putative [Bodo saltans]